jgi:DNA recombination protein RmuC
MEILIALGIGLVLGYLVAQARTGGLRTQLASAQLAEARLRAGDADLANSRRQVTSLVAPLHDQLERVEGQLRILEIERARASAELREQVTTVAAGSERLGRETRALVDALRRPQARGRWGELQLRRVVEHAGMLDRCDFDEQVSITTPAGVLRPDLVVRLAGGGCVVVDAKVTLAAYLEASEAPDEATRTQRMAAHAKHLRQHVDSLADKAYWQQLGMTRRVHLATPTTLLSLLRAVAYSWQQHQLTDNAQEVFEAGKELYSRLSTFGGHVDKLGRSLGTAVADFNKTVGSLERTVLPSARRMSELGLEGDLPSPQPIVDVTRPISAAHLVALPETG